MMQMSNEVFIDSCECPVGKNNYRLESFHDAAIEIEEALLGLFKKRGK